MTQKYARTRLVFRLIAVVIVSLLASIAIVGVCRGFEHDSSSVAMVLGITFILSGSAYRLSQPAPTDGGSI